MKWDLEYTREDIPVLGRLVSIAEDNVLASADQIWDEELHQEQSSLNDEFKGKLLQLENKNVYIIVDSTVLGALESRQITLNQNSEITTDPEDVQRTILSISIGAITSTTRQHINLKYEKLVGSGGIHPTITYRFSTIFVDSEGYSTMASVSISEQNFLRLATEDVDVQLTITPLITSDSAEGGSNLYWPDSTFIQTMNMLREINYPLLNGQYDQIPTTQAVAGYVSAAKQEITSEYNDAIDLKVTELVPAWALNSNKPSYTLDEVQDGANRKLSWCLDITSSTQQKDGNLYIGIAQNVKLNNNGSIEIKNLIRNAEPKLSLESATGKSEFTVDPVSGTLTLNVTDKSATPNKTGWFDFTSDGDFAAMGEIYENNQALSSVYLKKANASILKDTSNNTVSQITVLNENSVDTSAPESQSVTPVDTISNDKANQLITYKGLATYVDAYYTPTECFNQINGYSLYSQDGKKDISAFRSGTTSQRPNSTYFNTLINSGVKAVGYPYFDTTISKPIWYSGSNWTTWADLKFMGSNSPITNTVEIIGDNGMQIDPGAYNSSNPSGSITTSYYNKLVTFRAMAGYIDALFVPKNNFNTVNGQSLYANLGVSTDISSIRSGNARPTNPTIGYQFFDTTIGKPIWYNGASWVDATGTTV